jgi:hypothetical protein
MVTARKIQKFQKVVLKKCAGKIKKTGKTKAKYKEIS